MRHLRQFSPTRFQIAVALGGVVVAASTFAVAIGWARPAVAAACIADTGVPSGGFGLNFGLHSKQNFAGEFTVSKSHTIDSIMGWLSNGPASPAGAEVRITLHADGGDVPGAVLFSKSFEPSPWVPDPNSVNKSEGIATWQGVSDLNWTIKPGSYWASFAGTNNFLGTMPGTAPMPLDRYAYTLDDGVGAWWPATDPALSSGYPAAASGLALGIRVAGEPINTMARN